MRSRYAAFAHGEIQYLMDTHAPETRERIDVEDVTRWSKNSEWQGLEIRSVEAGGENDTEGTIEFTARYRQNGTDRVHKECSHFRRDPEAGWLFVEGHVTAEPIVRSAPKVGRNDPCPCGSGQKFKKCCG